MPLLPKSTPSEIISNYFSAPLKILDPPPRRALWLSDDVIVHCTCTLHKWHWIHSLNRPDCQHPRQKCSGCAVKGKCRCSAAPHAHCLGYTVYTACKLHLHRRYSLPRNFVFIVAVYTGCTLCEVCRYTATMLRYNYVQYGHIYAGYPESCSIWYTKLPVYTASTLYWWQYTFSIYCGILNLYCTSVWGAPWLNIAGFNI